MHALINHHPGVAAAAAILSGLRPPTAETDTERPSVSADARLCDELRLDLSDDAYESLMRSQQAPAVEWTEAEIAGLHWELLREVSALADPKTPLAEKIDTLDWVLHDESDNAPFSFASCVRVVTSHVAFEGFIRMREDVQARRARNNRSGKTDARRHMPPTEHIGHVDVDTLRGYVKAHARQWLRESLEQLPKEAREYFLARPHYAASRLVANPQFLNEMLALLARRKTQQGPGLFDEPATSEGDRS